MASTLPEVKPSKIMHRDHWAEPNDPMVTTYKREYQPIVDLESSPRPNPQRRFPIPPPVVPTKTTRKSTNSVRPVGSTGAAATGSNLAGAGRAALGMNSSGISEDASVIASRLAFSLKPQEGVSPANGAYFGGSNAAVLMCQPTYSAQKITSSYNSAFPDVTQSELPVDKTHHFKRNEMIEVARKQAHVHFLVRKR